MVVYQDVNPLEVLDQCIQVIQVTFMGPQIMVDIHDLMHQVKVETLDLIRQTKVEILDLIHRMTVESLDSIMNHQKTDILVFVDILN
jgi:hypothetical protein